MSLLFRTFSSINWKIFFSFSAGPLILFFLEYHRYSALDNSCSTHLIILCIITMICWAFCISLSIRVIGIWRVLPVLCITFLLIAMDYINYSDFHHLESDMPAGSLKRNLYCTFYHAFSIPSFFLVVILFSFYSRCRVLSVFRIFLFFFLYLFPLAIIGNKLFSGNGLNEDAMIAIQQTDIREAYHYFFGRNNGLLLLICLFLSGLIVWWISRFAFSRFKNRIKRQRYLSKLAAICCIIVLLPYLAIALKKRMYYYESPRIYRTLRLPFLYANDLKSFNEYRKTYLKKVQERLSSIDNWNCFPGKYVVVIGESLNRNYMGCYGYPKNTTPFQSSLKNDENFFLFKHCFSCYVLTQRVILLLLSDLNQYNGKGYEISDAISFLDIANLYDYHTEWVSGQEKISIMNSIISALAESADHVYFSPEKMPYRDLDLVQYLKTNNTFGQERSLTVLHLNGSHYPYHLAFPPDIGFDEQDLTLYEKSVCFNDTIMSRIHDLAKSNNVDVMLYVSDHSEGISTGKGHDSRNYTQEMTEIPLWIYISDKYRKEHPDIVERLRIATDQVFTNDLVFDLLLYLMGIENEFVDMKLVPGSDEYMINEDTARTLYGQQRLHINK